MSMSPRATAQNLLTGIAISALLAIVAAHTPTAQAQVTVPPVLSYGARIGFPTSSIASPGKVARDAAGNIYTISTTLYEIIEIPVNGPIQVVVPSTDPAFGRSLSTPPHGYALTADPAGNLYLVQEQYSVNETTYEIPRNANGTYGTSTVIATSVLGAVTGNFFATVTDIAVDSAQNIYYSNSYGIVTVNSSIANPTGSNAHYVYGTNGTTLTNGIASVATDAAGDIFFADSANLYEIPAASARGTQPATPFTVGTSATCSGCAAITQMVAPKYVFVDALGDLFVSGSSTYYVIPNTGTFSSASPTYALPNTVVKGSFDYGTAANNGDLLLHFGGSLELYGASKYYIGTVNTGNPIAVGASSSTPYVNAADAAYVFTQSETLGAATVGTQTQPYGVVNYGSANGGVGPAQYTAYNTIGTGFCLANTTYNPGAGCYEEIGYYPKDPGSFSFALALYNSSGTALTNFTTTSLATGSAVTVDTGVQTTIGTGYQAPAGIAIDNTGAMYVADPDSNAVYKYAAGSTAAGIAIGTGLSEPTGVAIDPAGNVYIADTGNDRIIGIPNTQTGLSTTTQIVVPTGTYLLSSPRGLAVDSFGNLYVSDMGYSGASATTNGRVLEIPNPFAPALGSIPTVIATGLNAPYGIALDPYNNLVIADKGANAVYETPTGYLTTSATIPGPGSGVLTSIGTGFSAPTGVATDGSGTVYVADSGNKRIVKIPSESGVITTADQSVLYSNLNSPFGIATDLTADLYFTDQLAPRVVFTQRSAPSGSTATTLAFGTVATSTTGTLSAIVTNSGLTTSLTFNATAVTAPATPFAQTSNTCTNSSTLLPGKTCTVGLSYTPAATGTNTSSFTITDNALAVTTATQKVTVTGAASGAVATVTLAGPAIAVYGDNVTFVVTAKDSNGNGSAAANGSYTVSITGTATSSASVTLTGGTGSFFLPSLGVGSYTLSVTIGTITQTANIALTKAPLYLTAANVSRLFDVANPALTASYSGFVNGDTAAVVTGTAPTIAAAVTRLSPIGNYPITLSGGSLTAANYTIILVNGVFAINGAVPQLIQFPALPNFTHGTTVTLTGISTSGLPLTYSVNGGGATVSGSNLTIGTSGTVTVTASQGGNNQYSAATPVARTFTAQ